MNHVPSDRVRVQREREFSPHHILIGAAMASLERAKAQPDGWFYDALVAMTFSAMALEALPNAFGERLIERWKDYESASPIAKLRIVANRLNLPEPSFNTEPWDFAQWLMQFRNKVAHAKPQPVKINTTMTRAVFEKMRFEIPAAKLERDISLENAEKALATVSAIFELLCKNTPNDQLSGLLYDSFSGTVSSAEKDKRRT